MYSVIRRPCCIFVEATGDFSCTLYSKYNPLVVIGYLENTTESDQDLVPKVALRLNWTSLATSVVGFLISIIVLFTAIACRFACWTRGFSALGFFWRFFERSSLSLWGLYYRNRRIAAVLQDSNSYSLEK